jgi:glutathione S-transferase
MALTLYGSPRSRAIRVLWMLEELDLRFEHRPVAWNDPLLKSADFLQLNPAGAIPVLVDDDFALPESLAINLYLAKQYGQTLGLYPSDVRAEAQVWRWTLWAQADLEPWLQRDAPLANSPEFHSAALNRVHSALDVLDQALQGYRFLGGDSFTVADLNVASALSPSRTQNLDLTSWLWVHAWLKSCRDRPAALRVRRQLTE